MTEGECWWRWWRHEPAAFDMTPSARSAIYQVCPYYVSPDTRPRPRDWPKSGAKDFWSGFFLMLHWGALGPIVNRFLVPFSILLEYELYTLICLCKNTFILLSFEVWVTKIIHVLNVVLCYLLCISTFKHLALNEVWRRASYLLGYEVHEMQWCLSNVLLNTK